MLLSPCLLRTTLVPAHLQKLCAKASVFNIPRVSASSAAPPSAINKGDKQFDLVIIGGGIVGLATARELILRHPQAKLAVVEKEDELSMHQTGHNSGVIHAGIYYTPGSLKAKLCVEGLRLAYKYCDENKIPYKKCGKLIVAVEPEELPRLDDLWHRGQANGVPDLRMIPGDKIPEVEPNCRGLRALHSPHTGIVDWRRVSLSYGDNFKQRGGKIYTKFEADSFSMATEKVDYPISVRSKTGEELRCKHVITCGGLQSDRLAAKTGCSLIPKIVPFRGDYLLLKPEKCDLIRGNIYPVPDPRFPFLGVHFTPRIDGGVWLGPNAILAFKREGYGLFDVNLRDTFDALSYSGLQKIGFRYLRVGINEMISALIMSRQVKLLQRFVPGLKVEDVMRGPSGVRAQALSPDGQLVDDFVFDSGEGEIGQQIMHVRNAPSPAATSSLTIAKMIADKAKQQFLL